MISNHVFNVSLFKQNHNYIELTSMSQVREFLAYLEWMHPYDCPDSVKMHAEIAERRILANGKVHFCLFAMSYHSKLERILTMCLGDKFSDGFKPYADTIRWKDFKHPLFIPSERDDSKLSPDMVELLESLQ